MRPAAFSPAALERELSRLVPGWPNARLLVALSGGVDSVALLAALAQLRPRGLALRAVYVDHGLLPQSPAWGRFCRRFASGLGVSCGVRRARIRPLRGESLEARARDERYRLLSAALRPGETLVTAQHEDDQAETLLLQLLRGAGIAGLAAMPVSMPIGRRTLVRPLLGFSRAALEDWARAQGLAWVDDESNADERYDRNFLRRQILPRLRERWPAAPRTIARAAANLAAAKSLLANLADLDLAGIQAGETLAVAGLRHLGADRQRNAVRRWLEARGLPRPERAQLERIVGELCAAREDATPLVAWPGAEVRRYRGRLYAMTPLGPAPKPLKWHIKRNPVLRLPAGLGELRVVNDAGGPLAASELPAVLRVKFRAGGERLRTEPAGPTRRLKELLRSGGILPWMRARIPLLHGPRGLLAVAGLWCNADLGATPRARRRLRIEWRGAPAVRSVSAAAPRAGERWSARSCD